MYEALKVSTNSQFGTPNRALLHLHKDTFAPTTMQGGEGGEESRPPVKCYVRTLISQQPSSGETKASMSGNALRFVAR